MTDGKVVIKPDLIPEDYTEQADWLSSWLSDLLIDYIFIK